MVVGGKVRRAVAVVVVASALAVGAASCSSDPGGSSTGSTVEMGGAPSTSSTTSTTVVADRAGYAAAIGEGLDRSVIGDSTSADQARCVGELWVDVIGVDAFASHSFPPDRVARGAIDYAVLGLTDEQADRLIDAFATCGVDLFRFVFGSLGPTVGEDQATCLREQVGDDLRREVLRGLLTEGKAPADTVEPLTSIAQACGIGAPTP